MCGGLKMLRRLYNHLNLLQPVNEKPHNNSLSYLKACAIESCERSLRAATHDYKS